MVFFETNVFTLLIFRWTLPLVQMYILFEADEFMSRQLVQKCEYQSDKKESEFEHSPYDYNNADDSEYCSQVEVKFAITCKQFDLYL